MADPTFAVVVLNGPQLGVIIVALFGAIWAALGASVLRPVPRIGTIAASVVVAVLLIMQARRMQFGGGYFHAVVYWYAVLFEVIAIVFAVAILRRLGDRTLIPPVISIIVGLHFIGLRLATGQDVFVWLAVAMCVFGSLALASPRLRIPLAGFGSALALWGSALKMLVG